MRSVRLGVRLRRMIIVGIAISLIGCAIALASLHAPCSAETIPGLPSGNPSCSTTLIEATGGLILFVVGIVIAVRGRNAPGQE